MIYFVVSLCVIFSPLSQTLKLHKRMTDEEVIQTFQSKPDFVPEYEVIFPKHTINKRSTDTQLEAKFFNISVNLYLTPKEGLLAGRKIKVWKAESDINSKNGFSYFPVSETIENVGKLYHDLKTRSAIQVRRDINGKALFEGTIGDNYVIRPVPERYRDNISLLNNIEDENIVDSYQHIVYKIPVSEKLKDSHELFLNKSLNSEIINDDTISTNKTSNYPDVVYPEILVFVDETLFKRFQKDVKKIVSYIVTFYNAVDLRFRALKNPKVRLNIAGIVLMNGVSSFMKSQPQLNEMLHDFGRYLHNSDAEIPFHFKHNYDIAVYMAGMKLETKDNDKIFRRSPIGVAIISGACKEESEEVKSTAIFRDNGHFYGILIAAHEITHLFGVNHDQKEQKRKGCENGYLMNPFTIGQNLYKFSPCSQDDMRTFFRSQQAECLYNPPIPDKPFPKVLPGKYLSLDDQCTITKKRKACPGGGASICQRLYCKNVDTGTNEQCVTGYPAAEGTPCGENMHCLNGECISESTKTISLITYDERRNDMDYTNI